MPSPDSQNPARSLTTFRTLAFRCAVAAVLGTGLLSRASAQEGADSPLRIRSVTPNLLRTALTNRWAMFDIEVANPSATDRQARVVAFYKDQPEVQYGRDLWVPANTIHKSWMLVGPVPDKSLSDDHDEVQYLLFDKTGGEERLVMPRGVERIRARAIRTVKPEPYTLIVTDPDPSPPVQAFGQLPQVPTRTEEMYQLTRVFRLASRLSDLAPAIGVRQLPPNPQALDGIDNVILASAQLAENPTGMRALRHWLEQGGRIWVMLDHVDPDTLTSLLGDALDFEVVDRVSLNEFTIEPGGLEHSHEKPVEFVHVLLPGKERVEYTIDGWPVWFTRSVGRGRVLFTTLGPRGWYKGQVEFDRGKGSAEAIRMPTPNTALESLTGTMQVPLERRPVASLVWTHGKLSPEELGLPLEERTAHPENLKPLLTAEVGYSVTTRNTVAVVFGAALLAALVAGVALRKTRRPELLGWLGPIAALGATGVFIALGESSRRAVPATVATIQIVHATPSKEVAVAGELAVYRPESGPVEFGATQGGFFEPDLRGFDGKVRRLILTDVDAWHWENLSLPVSVRYAPFRFTASTAEPLTAVARFGPDGLEGRLTAGAFKEPTDAVLSMPAGRNLAVRMGADGSFTAGSQDILQPKQFLAGTVLNDRQQRRQAFYRRFLERPPVGVRRGGPTLLAWTQPLDMHFSLVPDARKAGSALLIVPLRLERTAPGTRVTIPGPLITVRRVEQAAGSDLPIVRDATEGRNMELRFQVPAEVRPLEIERARVAVKLDAPARRITLSTRSADGAPVELHRVDSPTTPIRFEITDKRLLRLDELGRLQLNLTIGNVPRAQPSDRPEKWVLHYVEVEVVGTTKGKN